MPPLIATATPFTCPLKVRQADLDQLPDALLQCLSPDEVARAAQQVHAMDARRQRAARAWLRHTLAESLGCSPTELPLQRDAWNKPFLSMSTCTWQFNLSHSGPLVALVMAHQQPPHAVGIDIELTQHAEGMWVTRDQFMSDLEVAEVNARGTACADLLSLVCWTRKEAVLKTWGLGLTAPLPQVTVGARPTLATVSALPGLEPCHVITRVGRQAVVSVAWQGETHRSVCWPQTDQPNQSIW